MSVELIWTLWYCSIVMFVFGSCDYVVFGEIHSVSMYWNVMEWLNMNKNGGFYAIFMSNIVRREFSTMLMDEFFVMLYNGVK